MGHPADCKLTFSAAEVLALVDLLAPFDAPVIERVVGKPRVHIAERAIAKLENASRAAQAKERRAA